MTLFNRNWIGFAGDPLTGKTPTQTLVHADQGVVLTGQQQGAVAHAYKLFCDAITVSSFPGGYHVQNRTLADGTRVRMTSISGVHQVHVWPPGEDENPTGVFRGFVVAPLFVTGETVVAALDKTILTAIDKLGKWTKLLSPYRPGKKREALRYIVSPKKWEGSMRKLKHKAFELQIGKAIRRITPLSDTKYNDVFAREGNVVYRNAVPAFSLPVALADGYPAIFEATPGAYKVTVATDQLIQGITTLTGPPVTHEATIGYDWNTVSTFAAPGEEFRASVEIVATGADAAREYRANFLAYNITPPGAVQTWVATAKMLPAPPFATVEVQEFNQLGVQGALNSNDGWNSGVVTTGVARLIPIQDPKTLKLGYTYVDDPSESTIGHVLPSGEINVPSLTWSGGSLTTLIFDRGYSAPELVKMSASDNISISRSVAIDTTRKFNSSNYHLAWPYDTPLNRLHGEYVMLGSDWGVEFPKGSLLEAGGYESVSTLAHNDVATCVVDVPNTPFALWDVSVTHSITGTYGGVMEYPAKDFASSGAPTPPTGNYHFYLLHRDAPNGLWKSTGAGVSGARNELWTSFDAREDTHNFTAKSKDYVFSDRANDVFVWIEGEIVSAKTGNTAGSSSTVVRSCIRFNGVEHKEVLFSAAYDVPRDITLVEPWGIEFGTDALRWQYHQPFRPHPIYAPKWQDQGLCPYLAYTVANEGPADEAVTPRIAAHFRLQMERRYRSPLEPELPFLKNVVGFSPYMLQQLLENYGHVGGVSEITIMKGIFNILEATPVVIKLTSPDAALFTNLGAPDDDAKEYANFYRT